MKYIFLAAFCLVSLDCAPTCSQECSAFEHNLLDRTEIVLAKKGKERPEDYKKEVQKLRKDELALFERVRKCQFTNEKDHNYWYRGRLKFPTKLEQELKSIEAEEAKP
jgi:hypothetical protein